MTDAARMWRKGNPPTLLVGMQAGATSLENSMEVPQNVENGKIVYKAKIYEAKTGRSAKRYR